MTTATSTTLDVSIVPVRRPYGYSRGRAIPGIRPATGSAAGCAHATSGPDELSHILDQLKARLGHVLDRLQGLLA